jgi:predicted metalloprotease
VLGLRPLIPLRLASLGLMSIGLLVGCGGGSSDSRGGGPSMATTAVDPAAVDREPAELAYAVLASVAVADIEAFWSEQYPAVFGGAFEPVSAVIAYRPTDPDSEPECHGQPASPGNAFYCDDTDYIGYDDETFLADYRVSGDVAAATVLAHEYAHAIQQRVGVLDGPTFLVEQQADCLAGAWVGSVSSGDRTNGLIVTADDLTAAVATNLTIADPVGMEALTPGAHGSGFDRIRAFADGYEGGVAVCSAYRRRPPRSLALPYEITDAGPTREPLATLRPAVFDSLVTFWAHALPDFTLPTTGDADATVDDEPNPCVDRALLDEGAAVWCPESNRVWFGGAGQQVLWDGVGDAAAVYPFVHAWTQAVVVHLGALVDPVDVVIAADCLAGVWHRRLVDEYQRVVVDGGSNPRYSYHLAAGDLDEILGGVLSAPPTGPAGAAVEGVSPFERVSAFGDGFLEGEGSCVLP